SRAAAKSRTAKPMWWKATRVSAILSPTNTMHIVFWSDPIYQHVRGQPMAVCSPMNIVGIETAHLQDLFLQLDHAVSIHIFNDPVVISHPAKDAWTLVFVDWRRADLQPEYL